MQLWKGCWEDLCEVRPGRAWQEAEVEEEELVAARARLAAYSARPGEEEPPGAPPTFALWQLMHYYVEHLAGVAPGAPPALLATVH